MSSSNKVFGYTRVSTQKQGREGVSLEAQRDAIARYAQSRGLEIVEWIEDQESAARQGRTGFTRMVSLLRRGKASGFICHKLDRSVRNIYDWSDLNRLVDQGVQIHFAHESLDLDSQAGRLSGDILAAVAANFSRGLRDEVRKGMVGRLKQGYLPFAAPRGYLDCGAAKPKEVDPIAGPLVKQLFEMYSTGAYGFRELRKIMANRGLVTGKGKPLALDSLTVMLNNTFYYGVITIRRTGETYVGNHAPLISQALYRRCQDVMHRRIRRRSLRFEHTFRRSIQCAGCGRHLIGELQKGHVYYRCHSTNCRGVCIREEVIVETLRQEMFALAPIARFANLLQQRLSEKQRIANREMESRRKQVALQIASINSRLDVLLDMALDGTVERADYLEKRRVLVDRVAELSQTISDKQQSAAPWAESVQLLVELQNTLEMLRNTQSARETKLFAECFVSNLSVRGKTPCVSYVSPLPELVEIMNSHSGAPERDQSRTFEEILKAIGLCDFVPKSPEKTEVDQSRS